MINGISQGKIYEFEDKEKGIILKGIFTGKVITYNPSTIVQLKDIEKEGVFYNVKMEILKEGFKKCNVEL